MERRIFPGTNLLPMHLRKLLSLAVFLGAMLGLTRGQQPGITDPIVGRWRWNNSQIVIIRSDGTVIGMGLDGTWKCTSHASPPAYEINWSDRFHDKIHVLKGGKELKGQNNDGALVLATKIPDAIGAAAATPGNLALVAKPADKASLALLESATKNVPFVNTLGMKFVPVPIVSGPTAGRRVLFSTWDTRVQDYGLFVKESHREWPKPVFEQTPTDPAVNVSWEDAQIFCEWLTERDKAAGRLTGQWRYRLPSDHEWSCAAGIGVLENPLQLPIEKSMKIAGVFPWGKQWPPPAGAGNFAGEELRPALAAGKFKDPVGDPIPGYNDGFVGTSPVGSFAPNEFGLFDLGGNVWQWCEDRAFKDHPQRTLRGGSWRFSDPWYLISSHRGTDVPEGKSFECGFRCVLDMPVK